MNEARVGDECSFTRYPTLCVETLMETSSTNVSGESLDIVSLLVEKTFSATASHFSGSHRPSTSALDVTSEEDYCDELMNMSLKKLNQSLTLLRKSKTKHKDDLQTWLSAVLTYQDNCKDYTISNSHYTTLSNQQTIARMDRLSKLASNALALINKIDAEKVTDDDDFPNWLLRNNYKLLLGDVTVDAVVAKDGSGDYETVGEAVKAGDFGVKGRYVIYVKSGVYKEKIRIRRDGVSVVGDGKDSTVIEYGSSVRGGSSLIGSATFTVSGDGFMAKDIGFRNTAGAQGEQAIALAVASDRAIIHRCRISGHQDTLYAQSLRQFYSECDISGTIDFIFGNAATMIQSSNILLQKPKGSNVIMASGRTDPGQNTGFSIHRSRILPGSELAPMKHAFKSYLGRPWKEYSRTVVMRCNILDVIDRAGWLEWNGSFALSTLYYGEYMNRGSGANTTGRVNWPGFKVITNATEAGLFTVGEFIQGGEWLNKTGIPYYLNLTG